ncbi:MAG: PorP/SprF family type IX secretion system membrane protein [Reichenbachiella sp.]
MKYSYLLYLLLLSVCAVGQDAQFSQYFSTTTLINPAIIGTKSEMEFTVNYKRSEQPDKANFSELTQATFIYPIKITTSHEKQLGGVGISVYKERRGYEGAFTSQKILLSTAYSLRMTEIVHSYLSFGLQGGVTQNKMSSEGLTWGSQFNKYYGYDNTLSGGSISSENVFYPTFNVGIVYTIFDNENIFIRDRSIILGLSADNLNRPNTGQSGDAVFRKNIVYKAFGSIKMDIGQRDRVFIHPSFLTLSDFNYFQINAGAYFSFLINSIKSKTSFMLQIGSWYRVGDSVILMGGFQFEQLKLGVSFDLNTKTATENIIFTQSSPAFEVSLSYIFAKKNKIHKVSNPMF